MREEPQPALVRQKKFLLLAKALSRSCYGEWGGSKDAAESSFKIVNSHDDLIMRIAVWHNLPSGGGKRALYDHVRGLTKRGHQVEIWCPPTADRTYLPLDEFGRQHVVDLKWPATHRWMDKFTDRLGVQQSLDSMDKHCQICADQINSGRFDLLFANSCQFFRTTPVGRYAKLPSILYLQEPYRWLYEALPQLPWLAPAQSKYQWFSARRWKEALHDWSRLRSSRIQAREEVTNAAAFGRILSNSLFSRESILRAYGLDSDVCYLGVDTERFKDWKLPRESFLVGLGSFTREKNIGFVIESIALLPSPRPKLVWIGNIASQYLEEMERLASERGVQFCPRLRVSDDEIVKLLNTATAMVYAPRLEPFGLAPIEAGACGLPVIAVAEGGVRETVIHDTTGLLVQNDPRAAADTIALLLGNPTLARRLGDNGRAHVQEHWSLDALTDRIEMRISKYAKPEAAREFA